MHQVLRFSSVQKIAKQCLLDQSNAWMMEIFGMEGCLIATIGVTTLQMYRATTGALAETPKILDHLAKST